MIDLMTTRPTGPGTFVLDWSQGGRNTVINDNNCVYALTPAISARVRHLRFTSNRSTPSSRLLRIDAVIGGWEPGNFAQGERLIQTDRQGARDGPIIVTFHNPTTGAPVAVKEAGANLQSATFGEFTGVVTAVDGSGAMTSRKMLGESDGVLNTAIFIGMSGPQAEIVRLEFRTTNIVEDGHAAFDRDGFAINQLSVRP